jgi:hypothetical protein
MFRTTVSLPDDLSGIINQVTLILPAVRGRRVSLNGLLVELIQRGLATVADEPGWKDAIEAAKGGRKNESASR